LLKKWINKKQEADLKNCSLVVWNPNCTDTTEFSIQIAKELAKKNKKTIIVELPCLDIPRLSINLGLMNLEREKSISQILLDYERNELKNIHDYITKVEDIYVIPICPTTKPDSSVFFKLQEQKTLYEIPIFLNEQLLDHFDIIIFSLQGMLIHPMSFFALHNSKNIIMHIENDKEIPWMLLNRKKLIEDFAINKDQILLTSSHFIPTDTSNIQIHNKINNTINWISERSCYELDTCNI
jgi:hypothetical protein